MMLMKQKKGVAKNGFKLRLDEGARICKVINETSLGTQLGIVIGIANKWNM